MFDHLQKFNKKKPYRGVAQLVAREVWDFDAAGSSPVTPTIRVFVTDFVANTFSLFTAM